ncbi:MAG: DUF2799 domain-containing protein [Desulfobulbaceae bacterium]|nr:DUF2799 domain-containing protein [Desulfobulbaceae bacterium]
MKKFCLLLFLPFLAGCATLSQDQCQQGHWFDIGLEDGRKGRAMARLEQHSKACAKYGLGVDAQGYTEGRNQGLQIYCRLENAVSTGLKGERYQGVCPSELDVRFEELNAAAYAIYTLRERLDSIDDQLDRKEYQLDSTVYQLGKDEKARDAYYRLRRDIRELDSEREQVQWDLHSAGRYLDQLTEEYNIPVR